MYAGALRTGYETLGFFRLRHSCKSRCLRGRARQARCFPDRARHVPAVTMIPDYDDESWLGKARHGTARTSMCVRIHGTASDSIANREDTGAWGNAIRRMQYPDATIRITLAVRTTEGWLHAHSTRYRPASEHSLPASDRQAPPPRQM